MTPFSKIQSHLQNLLETRPALHGEPDRKQKPFPEEPSERKFFPITDLSELNELLESLPQNPEAFHQLLFSRMSLFFESGLWLKQVSSSDHSNQGFNYLVSEAFFQGEPFALSENLPHIFLPKVPFHSVVRFGPYALLAPLGLEKLCDTDDGQGLALSMSENNIYLFFSRLPELWLKSHVEKIHDTILKASADRL